ncbi:TIGR00297 family protein [Methanospirillum sp.]|uniref:TIGR00297 family protein n=1 Tax=Methanospirillum sp. TaxID=45200 RepID=UPI0035A09BBB
MLNTKRWIAFALAVLLLIISSGLPPVFPGLFVIIAAIPLWFKTDEKWLAIALGAIGLLNLIGILPVFVLYASILIITTKELVFSLTGEKTIKYALIFFCGLLVMAFVMQYLGIQSWLSAVVGATICVLLHSILGSQKNAIAIELVVVAMVMLLIEDLEYEAAPPLVWTAVVIAFGFSYFAYRLKTADIPGLFSAALVGILLIVFAGISWFLIMLSFFILGAAATRYKMEYKKTLRVEEEKGGVRGYINVFANGLVSVCAAVGFGVTQNPVFIAVYLGSVATAAADTVAGEIGVCSGKPRLITTFQPVSEGTNGGVTFTGEVAGFFGAMFIAACAVLLGVADFSLFVAAMIGGFIGTNLDSLLGELFENKHMWGNAGTNFLATLGGGVVTALLWAIISIFSG